MALKQNHIIHSFIIVLAFVFLIIGSCANMKTPLGGPRDSIPPKVLNENPKNLNTNFAADKIEIQLDEYFKLSNQFTEISISPDVEKLPNFKIKKKILEINFDKPLEKNTTYTINFGNAVVDVNEGNVLKDYNYVFSTGNVIDSLSISGKVTSSLTREVLKDAIVFIIPTSRDSIFGKKKANIFAITDSAGNFKLKNLHENTYRIYALKEEGTGDKIFNVPTDQIGFIKDSIVLTKNITDLKLEVFKEVPADFKILEKKIQEDGTIILTFNKPLKKPEIAILEKNLDSKKFLEINNRKDTALIWLPELSFDSISVAISDEAKILDTAIIRKGKKNVFNKPLVITTNLNDQKLKPKSTLTLTLSSPISEFDISKFKLLEDSIPVQIPLIEKDKISLRKLGVTFSFQEEKTYTLNILDNAIKDISGKLTKTSTETFTVDISDNYGNIALEVSVADTSKSYIVEWLNAKDVVLRSDVITKNKTLNYVNYLATEYHIRVIYDDNKNGIWDTGSIKYRTQPEKIWKFEKQITLRPNWDMEEKLSIPATPPLEL